MMTLLTWFRRFGDVARSDLLASGTSVLRPCGKQSIMP